MRIRWEKATNSRTTWRFVFLSLSLPPPDSKRVRADIFMDPSMYEHMQSVAFIVFVGLSPTPVQFAYFVPCRLSPSYCVRIEHKLALLHHNENADGERVRLSTLCAFQVSSFLSKNTIILPRFQRSFVPIKKEG